MSASSFFVVCLSSVSLGCSSPSWCAASSSLWDLSDVGLSASVLSPWCAESAASSALPLAEWSFAFGSASACSVESLSDLCVSASSLVDLVSASSFLVVCLSSVSLGCSSPSWCAASSSLWDLSDVGLSASVLSPWCAESAASSALPLAEWSFALGSASACSTESCPCLESASTLPEPCASPEPWPAFVVSAASSAWVGASGVPLAVCCLSPPPRSSSKVCSFLGVVGASGVPLAVCCLSPPPRSSSKDRFFGGVVGTSGVLVAPLVVLPAPWVPVAGAPVAGAPVAGAPCVPAPVEGAPVVGAPVAGAPVAGAPVAGAPCVPAPVAGAPVAPAPCVPAPGAGALVAGAPWVPVAGAPVAGAPCVPAPVAGAPVAPLAVLPAPWVAPPVSAFMNALL